MRFTLGLLSSSALAVVFAACSSPNPLGGLPQFGAGAGEDAGSSAPASNASANTSGDDDDDEPGSPGATSTPSPVSLDGGDSDGGASGEGGGSSSDGSVPSSDASAPTSEGGASSLLAHCVSDLNSYRAQVGAKALTESSALEAYGALAATSDSQSGTVHGYFASNDGSGVSSAESEIPGWALSQYASTSDLVDRGVAAIFNQGPGAAPYDNLVNATFTRAGCGVATTADGNVWVTFEYE